MKNFFENLSVRSTFLLLLSVLLIPAVIWAASATAPALVYNSNSTYNANLSVPITGQIQLGFEDVLYHDASDYQPHVGDGTPDTGDVYICSGAISNFTELTNCIGGENEKAITVSLGNYGEGTNNQINIDYSSLAYNTDHTIIIQGLYVDGTTSEGSDHYHQFNTNAQCGNGTIEDVSNFDDEQCDDSNTTPGDGCSATCTTEGAPLVVATSLPSESQSMLADANIEVIVPHIPDPPTHLDPDTVIPGNVILCQGNVGDWSGCTEEEAAVSIYDNNADGSYNGVIVDPTLTLAEGEYTLFFQDVCWNDEEVYSPTGNGETPYSSTIPDYCIDSYEWSLHFNVGEPSCDQLTASGENACNLQEGCVWETDTCVEEVINCYSYPDETTCLADMDCRWHPTGEVCLAQACDYYSDGTSCGEDPNCSWTGSACEAVGCIVDSACDAPCGGAPAYSPDGGTSCYSDSSCAEYCQDEPPEMDVAMVFITSTFGTGNLGGGTAGADAICDTAADIAGLDGTWKAIISDTSQNINTVLPDLPYIRLDGQMVAMDKAGLLSGTIMNPISITEYGNPMYDYPGHPLLAWTGSASNGIYYDDSMNNASCGDWILGTDAGRAIAGISEMTTSEWIEGCAAAGVCFPEGALYCDDMAALYCFSSDTTAMPGPPGDPGDGGYCGDGTADGTDPVAGLGFGEACDTDDLRSYTCTTLPDAPFTGGDLSCFSTCNFNVDECDGGGPPGGDGTGQLTANLVTDAVDGGDVTDHDGATVVVACGDLEITDPMNPPMNAFFIDGYIPSGQSSVTITGIPTPDDPNFTGPCIVFLSPDTAGIALGGNYYYTYIEGSLPAVGADPFSVSAGTLPMPPGAHYAHVQFGSAGENITIALNLETETLVEGSLSGAVCIDNDASGDDYTCGAGDTKIGNTNINIFTMGPPTAGGDGSLNTTSAGNGNYAFASLPGGGYMLEAFGMTTSGQEFMYMQPVTVNGATAYDIVISLGNSLNVTLVDPEVGSCWTGEHIFYDFFPMEWSFESMPVMGETGDLIFTLQGFGGDGINPMTYNGHIEVPGCKAVNLEITFDGDETTSPLLLTSGITATGRVVTDINNPGTTGVANFSFDAFKEIDPLNPTFGDFVGSDTDGNGDFTIYGLEDGNWVFQTFDMFGGQYTFVPGLGSMDADGNVTIVDTTPEDNINDTELLFVVKQDKRVNITVTDGSNDITNAMIDIACDSGKYVHLGHSNGVWTNLPGGDSCTFDIFSMSGTYMPLSEMVVITDDPNPQDVLLVLAPFSQNTGNYTGFIETDKTTAHKGGKAGYMAHIETNDLSPLSGHTLEIDFPTAIPNGNIIANSVIGTPCSVSGSTVTCAMGVDSFFDVFVEVDIPVDYPDTTLTAELFVNSVRTKLDTVVSSVVGLSINAPAYTDDGDLFTVYGQGYPDTTLKLVAKDIATGTETILGTTILAPGSSWYSFADVSLSSGSYTLKVTATADGIADSISRSIVVGSSVPTIDSVTVTGPYGPMPTNPATGYPAGQLFEGDQFKVDITFSGALTSVDYNFPVTKLPATAPSAFIPDGVNSWTMTMPAGWEGFGNVNLTVNAMHGVNAIGYGSVSEILVLIDPSGYIYDTVDANRISGADATVFQLVAGVSHATLAQGTAITSITGPDTNTDGTLSTAEEGTTSGEAVGKIAGCGNGTTLDTTLCTWSTWDASPSGQVNPQLTDVDGKYGWNVPQGWYRVSFAKSGEYSLNYSRDVYVPPAETTLNLDIGAYDIAAPSVVSINPAHSSTSVPTNVNPVVTFSEAMQASTINTTNIQLLKGATPVASTVTYNASNYTATIAPIGGLLTGGSAYKVQVGVGVKDDTSNALPSQVDADFTTATGADSTAPVSTADIAAGTYTSAQTVTLSATDDSGAIDPCTNCTIYYTTDDSTPTTSSAVYSSTLTISSTTTLKFFAVDAATNAETPVNSVLYTITVSAPAAPVSFGGSSLTNGYISLAWGPSAGATGYEIYRSETSGSGYASLATPTSTLHTDTTAVVGTTYYFKVRAINVAGPSFFTAEIAVASSIGDTCGNGTCDAGENTTTCPADCRLGGGGGGGYSTIVTPSQDADEEGETESGKATVDVIEFTDTVGHWAATYIERIQSLGIVSGKTENEFAPNDNITRAELTKIAIVAFGFDIPTRILASFTDVELTAWYAPYILAAKTNSIIDGYEDGGFSPNGLINRAEALKILLVAAGFDVAEEIEAIFPDVPVSAWFAKYVTYAYNNGIVGGYANGKFGPGNNITRAEVAKIVTKILDIK